MEEFKNIIGYENKYQINKEGLIKSVKNINKPHFLKPGIAKNGYICVQLRDKGNDKRINIHRLLAIHFIPNPDDLPMVDHINRNKLDNRLENLRWVNASVNAANKNKKGSIYISKTTIKEIEYKSYRICYTPFNKKRFTKRFKTYEEAEIYLKQLVEEDKNNFTIETL